MKLMKNIYEKRETKGTEEKRIMRTEGITE
jgi:hypothetical protein